MVFLDTGGLIAVVNVDDQWHDVAVRAWDAVIGSAVPLVTTNLVLVELGDGLSRQRYRHLATDLHDRFVESDEVEIVNLLQDDFDAAWLLFRDRPDKEWGMTDCTSMVVMHRLGVSRAFTTDHHFEQAGFTIEIQ
jgi:uncharacterized protein